MNPQIRIYVTYGDHEGKIDLELYPDKAPITVKNFLSLVDRKYYDAVVLLRITKDFTIQTGGYYVLDDSLYEKENVPSIKGEFSANGVPNDLLHTAGVISMARTNIKDSASSQFFICSVDTPHLDGQYAAFGKVIDSDSMNEVIKISKIPTTSYGMAFQDFPRIIVSIKTIERLN